MPFTVSSKGRIVALPAGYVSEATGDLRRRETEEQRADVVHLYFIKPILRASFLFASIQAWPATQVAIHHRVSFIIFQCCPLEWWIDDAQNPHSWIWVGTSHQRCSAKNFRRNGQYALVALAFSLLIFLSGVLRSSFVRFIRYPKCSYNKDRSSASTHLPDRPNVLQTIDDFPSWNYISDRDKSLPVPFAC